MKSIGRYSFQHTAARRRLGRSHIKLSREDKVSTHSRPKAAGPKDSAINMTPRFQHTAARRRLVSSKSTLVILMGFNTQPPEGGWIATPLYFKPCAVSTHSRPKAAGDTSTAITTAAISFNTQPPEGGWPTTISTTPKTVCFNTQPPEGGWTSFDAATPSLPSFNTQPPEGGWAEAEDLPAQSAVSTHSRPKAAGASLKSLAPSGFAAPISLSSQEKREREYNTAFSVTPAFAIS